MTSFIRSIKTITGYGNDDLLPPSEYLVSTNKSAGEQKDNGSDDDDCTGCSDPCTEHKEYPSYLFIDTVTPILGSVKPYGRHIIIATGTSDWPKKIEHETGSFASHLSYAASNSKSNISWKNLITNSSLQSEYSSLPGACDVLIMPDNIIVSNVTKEKADDFYNLFVNTPLPNDSQEETKSAVDIDFLNRDDRLGEMKVHKNPYKTMMLLCSHKKRDKRCGVTAPILAQELDHVLRENDLSEQDSVVIMVSHIGGHKLAGNVICYIDEGRKGIWYGRVKTCHCRAIVEQTIIKGLVIKDLYRGSMDNSFKTKMTKSSILGW